MTTDLEADLRREFDAIRPPSTLTFSPDSVLRQGSRTIRRRRIIAVGSTAMAVGLVVVGSTLMNRPHNTAVPQPATRTQTTGIVRSQVGMVSGTFEVDINRDAKVESNVKYSVVTPDGKRHDVGGSSTGKAGQKPDATWGSGIVNGHPVTVGLVPEYARNLHLTFTDGGSYGWGGGDALKDTGYAMFAVDYPASAKPTNIASIRWTGPTGIVDGIEGDHRLTGRTLAMSGTLSVEVVLRRGESGRSTVFGQTIAQDGGGGGGFDLSVATTDPAGVAVVTGHEVFLRKVKGGTEFIDGPPVAAGILPPGASGIGWVLSASSGASPVVVTEGMPDGTLLFAIKVPSAQETSLVKATVKAITWTNADGTQGRKDVTQKQRR